MSDRDKGLAKVLRELLPQNSHRKCIVHIERNFAEDAAVAAGFVLQECKQVADSNSASVSQSKNRRLVVKKKHLFKLLLDLLREAARVDTKVSN